MEFRAYCAKHYYYIQKKGDKYVVSEAFKGIPSHVRKGKDLRRDNRTSVERTIININTYIRDEKYQNQKP